MHSLSSIDAVTHEDDNSVKSTIIGWNTTSETSTTGISNDSHQQNTREEINNLIEDLLAIKERTSMLKDKILQQDNELKSLGVRCAKTISNLAIVKEQLELLMGKQHKPTLKL